MGIGVMPYHVAGTINAVLFSLCLAGVAAQLIRIWRRRNRPSGTSPGSPTAVLSLNFFSITFLAYFAFFLYGYCIRPFNHYLVWPRLFGCFLILAVIGEIARDRSDRISVAAFLIGLSSLGGGVLFLVLSPPIVLQAAALPQVLSLVVAVLVAQSLVHQILLIRGSGQPGAVSPALHLLTGTKDASTFAFGLAMGPFTGWPLAVMGGSSAVLKVVLLYQFRWASRSPVAALRRGERTV